MKFISQIKLINLMHKERAKVKNKNKYKMYLGLFKLYAFWEIAKLGLPEVN